MCPPRHFAIRYVINPWMRLDRPADPARAQRQWTALRGLLTSLGARVRVRRPVAGLPDLCFTANAGLTFARTFIPARFRHPERRAEEPVHRAWFQGCGWRIADLTGRHAFEGEGDALGFGDTVVMGFRFRSEAAAHEPLSRQLGRRVLPLELRLPSFYHLDTCFAPLDDRTALWYPAAFDRWGRRVIESLVPDPVEVERSDARRFACNAVAVGRRVVMHAGASAALRRALERRAFELRETDLSEFLKAGGAAKCLVLTLSGPGRPASA